MAIEIKLPCEPLTVIDPRIKYPKYTRNLKKERIGIDEFFMLCMKESAEVMYKNIIDKEKIKDE